MSVRFILTGVLAVAIPAKSQLPVPGSAELCGRCHRAIHDSWKTSSHAFAMESRLFQDSLELAQADFGQSARAVCLRCHAPLAMRTGDLSLTQKTSWEGVTCDYCHSIRDVDVTGPNAKAIFVITPVKTGPLRDSVSTGHAAGFSPVHLSSSVCAPCHEYQNSGGFPVLTTVSEWKKSRYAAEGKPCQSCHMDRVAGDVVDPHVTRSRLAKINLHQMPGSHSVQQLNRAVKARLSTAREKDRLGVTVLITNQTAGHDFPTGSPLRRLILQVDAVSGDGRYSEQRVYARTVGDRHRTPLLREHFVFLKAAEVLSDTRLTAGETRKEKFWFPVRQGIRADVKVTFSYVYSPLARDESQRKVTFLVLTGFVP